MPPALSHEKCRARMCCCCGVKLKSEKKVSARLEELVKQWGEDQDMTAALAPIPMESAVPVSVTYVKCRPVHLMQVGGGSEATILGKLLSWQDPWCQKV